MPQPDQASKRVLDGRYELDDVIGRGGMGEVWAATDSRLSRPVAVKILAPHLAEQRSARQRFEYEASSAAGLAHPNIVTVFDCGEDAGVPYLVMERLPGSTLADELRLGPMAPPRAIELACEVLSGLQCAHAAGVVHRDVKPGNVLMTGDGHAKVGDFGIAKAIEGADATITVELLATPYYLSPERLHGQPATPATDLFAVGVVMYEMLSGERPFAGDSPLAVMRAIESNQFVPLQARRADLPLELTNAVERALALDPSDRFRDAEAMAAAVAAAVAPAPPAPAPAPRAAAQAETVAIAADPMPTSTNALPDARQLPVAGPTASRAPRRARQRRPAGALIAGLVTLILVLAAAAAVLVLDDRGTPEQVDQSPVITAPPSGPAAPLPGPLERALRDLEQMVQP